jgi:hypothetical protein
MLAAARVINRPAWAGARLAPLGRDALQLALPNLSGEALRLVELGIQHEQQHQELLLTDILATFAENPLEPAYGELQPSQCHAVEPLSWIEGRKGLVEIGAPEGGFAFDCERPRHQALLHPHRIANRCATNDEWADFIADGGYRTPGLWLSEGWDWVQRSHQRPLYWHDDGSHFTLAGRRELDRAAPVAHVSYYEADASPAGLVLACRRNSWEDVFATSDPMIGHQLNQADRCRQAGWRAMGRVAMDRLGYLAYRIQPRARSAV